ncbi:hypothetical protein Tco_0940560 [Tanacetum coccineum]|uniref:Uncharacterized protein n=1 Tax=Tanacetum coccineum TaxID=301880 RepID=A0ABQ5DNC2_9ASTR
MTKSLSSPPLPMVSKLPIVTTFHLEFPPRPLTQAPNSMEITLSVSPITPLDVHQNSPSLSPPIIGHPIPWNLLKAHESNAIFVHEMFNAESRCQSLLHECSRMSRDAIGVQGDGSTYDFEMSIVEHEMFNDSQDAINSTMSRYVIRVHECSMEESKLLFVVHEMFNRVQLEDSVNAIVDKRCLMDDQDSIVLHEMFNGGFEMVSLYMRLTPPKWVAVE